MIMVIRDNTANKAVFGETCNGDVFLYNGEYYISLPEVEDRCNGDVYNCYNLTQNYYYKLDNYDEVFFIKAELVIG